MGKSRSARAAGSLSTRICRSQRRKARPLRETVSMAAAARGPGAALGGRPGEAC